MLEAVRELKSLNVDVFFEKENIYTLDSKGELLITIMSSLAQEESLHVNMRAFSIILRRFFNSG